jgi:hypothetical protein
MVVRRTPNPRRGLLALLLVGLLLIGRPLTVGHAPYFDGVWDSTRLYYREELCGGYLADAYSLLPLIKEIAHGPAEATYRPRAQT